ncbi:radical SAM protein [Candidatus Woesearchaeota archaeon]|nr:radical SAM protein [Candidatus Woesearchaeota archaeon]
MSSLIFETLTFRTDNESVHVDLLRSYTTKIPNAELEVIAPFTILNPHEIEFQNIPQKRAETRFLQLLNIYFEHLTTKLTGNPVTYIHRNSGIPLIGNVAFGIIYRNSSIIEIKTNNGCNLDCVYCSIAEGLSSKKHDFVIEKDYLLDELDKLLAFVDEPVEIHIGVQGEPFLYSDMENLIEDLQEMEQVHTISIDTNGTLLSKAIIDHLAHCTKLQLNLSLDATDEETAKDVAGVKNYNVKHVKEIISYASQKVKVIVAPVLTMGYNEQEMEKIILFVKSLSVQPILGIQNFLRYKTGRNPGKEMPWEQFYALLEKLEQKHDLKLRLDKADFAVHETRELPKPFQEGDIVTAIIKAPDRFPKSVLAVAQDRTISVPGCLFQKDKKIKVKILRDKHNIFVGKLISG